jgi:hypothetical protein
MEDLVMGRFTFTRDFYVPAGSVKVADKASDAVAYVYITAVGKAGAAIFYGKQAKPVSHFTYRDVARRDEAVKAAFDSRARSQAFKAERQQEKKNFVHDYKVGDIFYTSWGYDQTNVDFFEVTKVAGKMLTVQAIGASSEDTGYLTGNCKPRPGAFLTGRHAKTFRVLARKGGVTIDGHSAWRTDASESHRWSSYA